MRKCIQYRHESKKKRKKEKNSNWRLDLTLSKRNKTMKSMSATDAKAKSKQTTTGKQITATKASDRLPDPPTQVHRANCYTPNAEAKCDQK